VSVGASIDLQKGANLLMYLQREQQFNPNVAFMTPIFCETLLKGRKSTRKYRLTIAAGDRCREETFSKYESRMGTLVKLYGSTEMGAISAASPDEGIEVRSQTVGKPMAEVQMRLQASPELGKKEEDVGELWCYHNYGFDGYVDNHGDPVHQSPENQEDGWFRTKDLGRILADDHIEVLGRSDHSVNRDGLLVFFSEVEQAIESISGIDSVVVVSKGESQRGKALTAYCVPAKGSEISVTEIKSFCFNILPKRAIPDYVNIVKSLPLMSNGKVDRQKLMG
jgi:acyl-CoA synthetase (AMP-forming)/AMP-acid ligase II